MKKMKKNSDDLNCFREGNVITAENMFFSVNFDLATGKWNYSDRNENTVIRSAQSKIVLENGFELSSASAKNREFIAYAPSEDSTGTYQQLSFACYDKRLKINLHLKCYSKKPYILFEVEVENLTRKPIAIAKVSLIDVSPEAKGENRSGLHLDGLAERYRFFLNGHPIDNHGIRKIHNGTNINGGSSAQLCYDGGLYNVENNRSMVFGFLDFKKWWHSIELGNLTKYGKDRVSNWSMFHICEGQKCPPQGKLTFSPVYLNFIEPTAEAYEKYAQLLADRMSLEKFQKKEIFTSWRVPEKSENFVREMVNHAEFISKSKLFSGEIKEIQLSSSWQKNREIELDRSKFPKGMKDLTDQIRKLGLSAGITFTPFCVSENSELLKSHVECFLQEKDKKISTIPISSDGSKVALIDVSHPKSAELIERQVAEIVDTWGFERLRADLHAYLLGPLANPLLFRWHDRSLTSIELYRLGVKLLKKSVENRNNLKLSLINAPYSPSIDLVLNNKLTIENLEGIGSHKIGMNEVERNISSHALLSELNQMVHSTEFGTLRTDEPLPLNEVLVALTAAALSGSSISFSDRLTELKASRAELISRVLPLSRKPAIAIDRYKERFPKFWNLPMKNSRNSWNIVGVFNWSNYTDDLFFTLKSLNLDPSKDYLVHDFWNCRYLGSVQNGITLMNMPLRSAQLLIIREHNDYPQLIGTDLHFLQDLTGIMSSGWDRRSQSFLATCNTRSRKSGTILIHVPENYIPVNTACYGANYNFSWTREVHSVSFEAPTQDVVQLAVQFTKSSGRR